MPRPHTLQLAFTAPWTVELAERSMPRPGPGEALIATQLSLISTGTELTLLSGQAWSPLATSGQTLPAVGYSNVGTVVEVGSDVDPAWIGRRVASRSIHASHVTCLVEPTAGAWRSGVFAIPDEVSNEDASLFALGVTALNGVLQARLRRGETVAVVGLGLLGQLTIRSALRFGAAKIFAIGRGSERLRFLPQADVIHPIAGGIDHALTELGQERIDVVLEVTGDPAAVAPSLALVRPGGRMVLLGSSRGSTTLDLHALCAVPSRSIIGAHIGSLPALPSNQDAWCVQEAARIFFDRADPVLRARPDLVTHHFRASAAALAYAHLREPKEPSMGCVLDWLKDAHAI